MLAKSSEIQRIIYFPSMLCTSNGVFTDRPLREVLVHLEKSDFETLEFNSSVCASLCAQSFNNLDNCIGTIPSGSRQGQTVSDNPTWAAKEIQMMSTV